MPVLLQNRTYFVIGVLAAVVIIALVLGIIALLSEARLRRRFRRWKDIHATADLEAVYQETLQAVRTLRAELETLRDEVRTLETEVRRKVSTPQVLRYNAFDGQGSDLSFSIALLDDHKDGVVISSIYGREESRTYAKPITNGESSYPLTDEETDVISNRPRNSGRPVHA